MRGKKILTVLVVIAMVAATMMVLNKMSNTNLAGAVQVTPGYNYWQGNNTDSAFNKKILNNSDDTASIYYNNIETLEFNGSIISETCSLYYPDYNVFEDTGSGNYEVYCNWTRYAGVSITPTSLNHEVTLHRAGLWLIVPNSASKLWHINMNNMSVADPVASSNYEDITGWFWVNASEWTVTLSKSTVYYDKNESLTVTVKDGDGNPIDEACFIDIWNAYDVTDDYPGVHRLVYHKALPASANGVWTVSGADMYRRTHGSAYGVGTYRVTAYGAYEGDTSTYSSEALDIYGESGDHNFDTYRGYNDTFGQTDFWPGRFIDSGTTTQIRNFDAQPVDTTSWTGTTYKWETCGPFDPPEYWADYVNFSVKAGVPDITNNNGTSMFWNNSYSTTTNQINLTIKDYDNNDMTASLFTVGLYNKSNNPSKADSIPISTDYYTPSTSGSYLTISPNGTGNRWGWNQSNNFIWAPKGKLYITLGWNSIGNASEEWNTTLTIRLTSAANAFEWIHDGSIAPDSGIDGELGEIPDRTAAPVDIIFRIVSGDYYYWGDGNAGETVTEAAENITISGNSLFTGDLDKYPNFATNWFSTTDNTWTVPIIPTMSLGGGEITISANAWNSTIVGKLSIGGTRYYSNGTIITVTPNRFEIDEQNQTLDITVQTGAGVDIPGASVTLYYIDEDAWDAGAGPMDGAGQSIDVVTSGATPTYSIHFNTTQQTTNQTEAGLSEVHGPRNLTVYVSSNNMYGWALIRMDPNSDLEVDIGRETMMAGYPYNDFSYDVTFVANNDTPSSEAADKNNFHVKIYNEDFDDVTASLFSDSGYGTSFFDGEYSRDADDFVDIYAITPGTYTFYAYNKTHDSTGHNATLVVDQVEVTCDKSPFIWKHDDNISATFSCRYNGLPLNGSLIIDNVTDVGTYNMTYKNTSFDGSSDLETNTSIEIDEIDLVDGDITVHDITAWYLPEGVAEMNVTFWFRPIDEDENPGAYARAKGRVPVSVPTVTPTPMYVAQGERTTVKVLVTGRGVPIDDIFVGLSGRGVSVNGTSGTDGIVTFSIQPTSTGNISIDVGEEGRTVDTVIISTAWVLDVNAPAQVMEGEDFTVTVTEESSGDPIEGCVISVQGIGTATTDSSGEATFTAPDVTSDRTYSITASKGGYAPDDAQNIVIVNVPKLYISAPSKGTEGESFTVKAGADDGNNNGITVTVKKKDGTEVTSGTTVNGEVKLKVETKGSYTIQATKADYVDSTEVTIKIEEKGAPGFELLTLIIAIGIAFILLRRRRH